MGLGINFKFPLWTRSRGGENFYDITAYEEWSKDTTNLYLSQTHPLLSPAMLFIAKLFSQAQLKVVRASTGEEAKNHSFLKLLKNPNYNQTQTDFLESLIFTTIANGVGVVWGKKTLGVGTVNSLYILDYTLISFPEEIKKNKYANRKNSKGNIKVVYDKYGEDITIPLKDLLFFYDMPNQVNPDNIYDAKSRIDGLKQTLYNTQDSLIAKSIIIKSNGKELITGVKDGFPLKPEEKEEAERIFNSSYGLGRYRKRGLITKASVKWQSMHVIMRDLGADEGIQTDAAMIFAGLHLPNDVYSIKGSKSTYKNANQSLVSYIQNEMQSTLESTLDTINKYFFSDGIYHLQGSDSHLPVMLSFKTTEYEAISAQAKALNDLLTTGLPEEIALEMAGFDKSIKLEDVNPIQSTASSSNGEMTEEEEEKIRQLIEDSNI
jgi:hypothetical protein